jgi:hypothetical protein
MVDFVVCKLFEDTKRGKSKAVKRIRTDNAMAKKKDDKTTNNKLLSTRHDTENTRLSNTNY